MRLPFVSLLKPSPVVAMHDGDVACDDLRARSRRAGLFAFVVLASATYVGHRIEPETPTLVAGLVLTVALVVVGVAAGRTRALSLALLIGLSTMLGVLIGLLDGVRTGSLTDGASEGSALVGAGLTCVVALAFAEVLNVAVRHPTVSLAGPIVIGALAPWSSSFGISWLPSVAPLGAFVGAVIALVLILSARLADVAMPYLCARDEGVSGALLRYVEIPRLLWSSTLGDGTGEGHV